MNLESEKANSIGVLKQIKKFPKRIANEVNFIGLG